MAINGNISELPLSSSYTPEQALAAARRELKDVLIMG